MENLVGFVSQLLTIYLVSFLESADFFLFL